MTSTAAATGADLYLEAFERLSPARSGESARLASLRRRGADRFAEVGFPTTREEAWRFTNVAPVARTRFEVATGGTVDAADVEPHLYPGAARLVFVDGRLDRDLSDTSGLPGGVVVSDLASALAAGDETVEEHLGRYADLDAHPFAALNTALFADGALVRVPAGTVVEKPLVLLYLSTGGEQPLASFPRTLLVAEATSQLTVVERFAGAGEGRYLTCPVTELVLGQGAVVDHYKMQQEGGAGYHLALQDATLGRDANFSSNSVALGGEIARTDVHALLDGEGIDAVLNGLYLTRGKQLVDHHMLVEHAKPHCSSHELYKGILEEQSRAVFNGLIHVHQKAQKTDAKQTNRNLLLSREALVNTNPQLLIFADDVKCTHGSTVGQLDRDAVFYLRSRGLSEAAATSLLTFAFAAEIVSRIRFATLREELENFLFARLPHGEVVRQAV